MVNGYYGGLFYPYLPMPHYSLPLVMKPGWEIYLYYHLLMTNIAMDNPLWMEVLMWQSSISMGHLYHGYVSHNQMGMWANHL